MRAISSNNFDQIYQELMALLLSGVSEPVLSSKGKNLEIRNIGIELTDINRNKINFQTTFLPERQEKYERYLNAELEWYLKGGPRELHYKGSPAPKQWKKYAGPNGKIVSNYGYIILREKKTFGQGNGKKKRRTDAYTFCLDTLTKKKSTRQAILHYNLPKHFTKSQRDVPCTVAGQILIRNDKLSMTVFQRSSDIFTGIPYDIPWHCELMKRFVKDLRRVEGNENLEAGSLTLFVTSLHLYEENFEDAIKISQNIGLRVA